MFKRQLRTRALTKDVEKLQKQLNALRAVLVPHRRR